MVFIYILAAAYVVAVWALFFARWKESSGVINSRFLWGILIAPLVLLLWFAGSMLIIIGAFVVGGISAAKETMRDLLAFIF